MELFSDDHSFELCIQDIKKIKEEEKVNQS